MKLENPIPFTQNWLVSDFKTNPYGTGSHQPEASYTTEYEAVADYRQRCENAKAQKITYWTCTITLRTPVVEAATKYEHFSCRQVAKTYRAGNYSRKK